MKIEYSSVGITHANAQILFQTESGCKSLGLHDVVEYGKYIKTDRFDIPTYIVGIGNSYKDYFNTDIMNAVADVARDIVYNTDYKIINVELYNVEADSAILGIGLGGYKYDVYLSDVRDITFNMICTETTVLKRQTSYLVDAVNVARDLVNGAPSDITPQYIADNIGRFLNYDHINLSILDHNDIKREGLNLISAVGQASKNKPKLIIVEYKGNPETNKTLGLIGKGITFDSGGLNIKTGGSMTTMKCDMAGAAAVLGVLYYVTHMNIKANVTFAIPLAENAVGPKGYKPGDVIKSYSGQTVEITNTDAEGRLILADAISYIIQDENITECIDIATLTGSVSNALGPEVTGMFSISNDEAEMIDICETIGEPVCSLPIHHGYSKSLDSKIADMVNSSDMRSARGITAALFLRKFYDSPNNSPAWTHFDIAGTAFNSKAPYGIIPSGATGVGVRLLCNYIENVWDRVEE